MTRYTRIATQVSRTRTSRRNTKKSTRAAAVPVPVFKSSGDEDDLEANIAFLIDLVSHQSIYENYVDILNERLNNDHRKDTKNIEIVEITDNDLNKLVLKNIKKSKKTEATIKPEATIMTPKIFHGRSTAFTPVTHYKSTINGTKVINSYYNKLQKQYSNHFCQTFAMMYIESSLFPDSDYAREYEQMLNSWKKEESPEEKTHRLIHNSIIAKNYACHIIETVYRELHQSDVMIMLEELLTPTKKTEHLLVNETKPRQQIIPDLLKYCRSLRDADFEHSTLKDQLV
jgi:hypothetical protein